MPTLTPYEGMVYEDRYDREYRNSNPAGELGSHVIFDDVIPERPVGLHINQDRTRRIDPYYLAICPTCQKKMHSIHNQRMYKCMFCGYSISRESFLHKKNDPRKIEHARIRRERRALQRNNSIGGGYVNFDVNSIASVSPWTTTGTYTFGSTT